MPKFNLRPSLLPPEEAELYTRVHAYNYEGAFIKETGIFHFVKRLDQSLSAFIQSHQPGALAFIGVGVPASITLVAWLAGVSFPLWVGIPLAGIGIWAGWRWYKPVPPPSAPPPTDKQIRTYLASQIRRLELLAVSYKGWSTNRARDFQDVNGLIAGFEQAGKVDLLGARENALEHAKILRSLEQKRLEYGQAMVRLLNVKAVELRARLNGQVAELEANRAAVERLTRLIKDSSRSDARRVMNDPLAMITELEADFAALEDRIERDTVGLSDGLRDPRDLDEEIAIEELLEATPSALESTLWDGPEDGTGKA